VCERVSGTRLSTIDAEAAAISIAAPLRGRDRLLALMDLGATVCTARAPSCDACPIAPSCAAHGPLTDETRHRQAAYQGSFRQRRGIVLAALRAGATRAEELDGEALASLLDDGLAEVTRGRAHLALA
jgi:A/G-specific adenine glycosylase